MFWLVRDHHQALKHGQNGVNGRSHLVTDGGCDHLLYLLGLLAQLISEVAGPVLEKNEVAVLLLKLDVNQVETYYFHFVFGMRLETFIYLFGVYDVVESVNLPEYKCLFNRYSLSGVNLVLLVLRLLSILLHVQTGQQTLLS